MNQTQRSTRPLVRGLAILGLALLGTTVARAQSSPRSAPTDALIAVAERVEIDLRSLPVLAPWQPGDPITGKPFRFEPKGLPPRAPAVSRRDPLVDRPVGPPTTRAFGTPTLNLAGLSTGAQPPDTVGDVSHDHYIQMVNGGGGARFSVFRKSDGVVLAGPIQLSGLGTGSCASARGDGIALFDSLANRWLLSEIGSSNRLCIYLSQTSDPIAGGWFAYQVAAPSFPDYPKYAVWSNAYVITTNEGVAGIYALDREAMLAGLPTTTQRFAAAGLPGFSFQILTAADADATPPPIGSMPLLLRHRDDEEHSPGSANPTNDFVELFALDLDFTNAANSALLGPTNIAVAEFDSSFCGSDLAAVSCIPQTTGTRLDALREPIMNRVQYRNFVSHESLIGNFVTDVNGADRAGIRWFELRRPNDGSNGGAWSLFQEGTHSPDAAPRWIGSIAMDRQGNIALGYSVSSAAIAPSIRYAGRLASDPLGTLPQSEHSIQIGNGTNPSSRWGDYSAMTVDPSDDCTFWFTTEYANGTNWASRVASFRFDSCAAPVTSPGSYFTVTPCRALDTRELPNGPLVSDLAATYQLAGTCGIPPTAKAIAANVTAVAPTGEGFITLIPGGAPPTTVSTLNFGPGQTRANNAVVALSLDGNGSLVFLPFVSDNGTAHLLVDVVGYFE